MEKEIHIENTEKNRKILELKNLPSVCTYIEILQNVITRMGGNSGNIKASITVVYTIFATVIHENKDFWWIGFIIIILACLMDSYYLALERIYRRKYNDFLKDINAEFINEKYIFNMNPKNVGTNDKIAREMIDSLKSFSVWGFYLSCVIINVLLKII